jgi:hypothetical protein
MAAYEYTTHNKYAVLDDNSDTDTQPASPRLSPRHKHPAKQNRIVITVARKVLKYSCAWQKITSPYNKDELENKSFVVMISHANECAKDCKGDGIEQEPLLAANRWELVRN